MDNHPAWNTYSMRLLHVHMGIYQYQNICSCKFHISSPQNNSCCHLLWHHIQDQKNSTQPPQGYRSNFLHLLVEPLNYFLKNCMKHMQWIVPTCLIKNLILRLHNVRGVYVVLFCRKFTFHPFEHFTRFIKIPTTCWILLHEICISSFKLSLKINRYNLSKLWCNLIPMMFTLSFTLCDRWKTQYPCWGIGNNLAIALMRLAFMSVTNTNPLLSDITVSTLWKIYSNFIFLAISNINS